MNRVLILLTFTLAAAPVTLLITAAKPLRQTQAERVERGSYLVTIAGCHDCHTPLKPGPHGPEPDLSRALSGHPESAELPPPPTLPAGPWFAMTAGMTAWAGPWGISYAANLTPDEGTGMGIWTEDMFLRAMRTGKHMGIGREILPPMPWRNVGAMGDEDLKAIFAYLRSLPPIKNSVPTPRTLAGQPVYE